MNRREAAGLSIIGIAGLGVVLMLYATAQGAGTSPDSVGYVRNARAMAAGNAVASGQFPPLFSALLGSAAQFGGAPLDAARWLNALLFGANLLLVGVGLLMCFSNQFWLAVLGPSLLLITPVLTDVHVMAWSEPLFLFLTLSCLIFLARWIEKPRTFWWVASASTAALALLTRYLGLALILSGALGILWLGRQPLSRRAGLALLWSMIAVMPLTAWLLLGAPDTGRALGLHPPGLGHLQQALITTTGWLQVPGPTEAIWRIAALGAIFAWAAIIVARRARPGASTPPVPTLLKLLGLFALSYATILILAITFFDANTPLDDRILSPIFAVGVFGALYLAEETIRLAPSPAGAAAVLAILALLFGVLALRQTVGNVARQHREGIGFSSLAWKHSGLLQQVSELPQNITVFSNAPEPIYLITGREARPFPRSRDAMSDTENASFSSEMNALGDALRTGEATAIFFRTMPQRARPSEDDLLAYPGVRMQIETTEGAIYSGSQGGR